MIQFVEEEMTLMNDSLFSREALHEYTQAVSQEGKKFGVWHELANETQLGIWGVLSPSVGSVGDQGGGSLGKFTIFSLKLVWCSLLEIIKLKLSVYYIYLIKNCYYNLKYVHLCMLSLPRSRMKQR